MPQNATLEHVSSADGTSIAYEKTGSGPAVVLVCGGSTDRGSNAGLAAVLSATTTVFNFDRRGRGDSGDTPPYAVDREFEDLQAVIDAAGGSVSVYGTSGGAIFGLQAAARGLPITRMVLWEPAYVLPGSRPPVPADYEDRLRELLAQDRRGDMVELFLTDAVGIPAEFVAQIREYPGWAQQEAVAHVLVYDAMVVGDFSVPRGELAGVATPTLVLDGGTTPWLSQSADAVAAALPQAERATLTGQQHNVEPEAIAPAITRFLVGEA
jgi:alpha-beta hydrolase superfamily lysophospholipase